MYLIFFTNLLLFIVSKLNVRKGGSWSPNFAYSNKANNQPIYYNIVSSNPTLQRVLRFKWGFIHKSLTKLEQLPFEVWVRTENPEEYLSKLAN